jgi:hydrogenase expression/formation protein HypC
MCLAIPGKILSEERLGHSRTGRVQFGGITRETSLDLVPEAQVGEYVLVHVGVAIHRIDEVEAARTWEVLRQLGELEEEAILGSPDEIPG